MDNLQWGEQLPWINLAAMVLSSGLMFYFYIRSSQPAQLEVKIGEIAYQKCGRYRIIASVFELTVIGTYVVYYFYPLPLDLPQTFPWSYWVSVAIVVIVGVPSGYIMLRGVLDAGEEAMLPKKKHRLYGGIYKKIRHPQAMGELPLWWVIALILNSPFLALYSIIWIPVFVTMCLVEEKDLAIRYGKKYELYREKTGFIIPRRE